jgi:hypothetical protein
MALYEDSISWSAEPTPEPPGGPRVKPRPQTRLNGITYEYPICHECQTPVRAFTWGDFADEAHGGIPSRAFFALCHGRTDTIVIPLSELKEGMGIVIGEAFVTAQHVEVDVAPPMTPAYALYSAPFTHPCLGCGCLLPEHLERCGHCDPGHSCGLCTKFLSAPADLPCEDEH